MNGRALFETRDHDHLRTDWRDSEFIAECLCWHNVYRQRHDAPPLTMSPRLCEYAQTWANRLAHTDAFYYRTDRQVGQNLYCRPGVATSDTTAAAAADDDENKTVALALADDVTGQDVASYWYSAVKRYDFFKQPDVLHAANVNAGHFAQLVWAASRYFGVGKARSRSGKIIVVANYRPVGNLSGQFRDNVFPPLPDNFNINDIENNNDDDDDRNAMLPSSPPPYPRDY